MRPIEITLKDDALHIEGFPDAAKVVALDDDGARLLADLMLHSTDLRMTVAALDVLDETPEDDVLVRESLWRAALVSFFKCFGKSAARTTRLDPSTIYANEIPQAREAFDHLKHLRNKHVVHDENAWTQVMVAAILNQEDAESKVEEVVASVISSVTSVPQNSEALRRLTSIALAYAESECDRLCAVLQAALETQPYDALIARPAPSYWAPPASEVGVRRKR